MIRNNVRVDVKTKMLEQALTNRALGSEMGLSEAQISYLSCGKGVMNKNFVKMMEVLGYDIQISYEKIRP